MTPQPATLRIGSLFSGHGGLDMAVEEVFGARTAWVSDIDKGACKVLAHRYPHAPNLGDITAVDWATVEPVDIITGGSPCQDLSTAGRRAGMTDGTRSNLWVQMREAIAHVQPRFVVWENVRGALSAHAASDLEPCPGCVGDGGDKPSLRALGRVLGDLADLGFDAEWRGLRAADVGACHQRFRVFVLAWRRDMSLPHTGHGPRSPQLGQQHEIKTSRAGQPSSIPAADLAMLPTPSANLGDNGGPQHPDKRRAGGHSVTIEDAVYGLAMLPTPRATDGTKGGPNQRGSSGDLMLPSAVTQLSTQETETIHAEARPCEALPSLRRLDGEEAVREATRGSDTLPEQEDLLPAMREQQEVDSGGLASLAGAPDRTRRGVPAVRSDREAPCASPRPRCHEQRPVQPDDALRELPPQAALARRPRRANGVDFGPYEAAVQRWEAVLGREAPAPTEPGKNGRPRLSAEFASWMMGLPDGWITDTPGVTRNEALKLCGNGVVPQQAAAALAGMLHAMRQEVAS